jgi:hypothetical protein
LIVSAVQLAESRKSRVNLFQLICQNSSADPSGADSNRATRASLAGR